MKEQNMVIIPTIKATERRSWYECGHCKKVYWRDSAKTLKHEESEVDPPCGHNATQALISEPIAIMKLRKKFKFVVEEKK